LEGGEAGSWKMLALSSPASVLTIQVATDDTTTNTPDLPMEIVFKVMQYISSGEAALLHNSCAFTRRPVHFAIHGPKQAEMFM
jgi:hypothetical protein